MAVFIALFSDPSSATPLRSERLSHREATSLSQKLGAPPLRSTSLVTHGSQGPIPPALPSRRVAHEHVQTLLAAPENEGPL